MAQAEHGVTVGVDTHGDAHVAAAFTSDLGRPLGYLEVATTPAGYRRLLEWARSLGNDPRFGVEGTGSYGAGLARFLDVAGCTVIEVNRPNRRTRYARGKSDPVDAEAAARAVLSGEACGIAKGDTDHVGMIRALRVARRSALKMRTQTFQQMKALLVTAPADLREQLRTLSRDRLVETAANMRPGRVTTVAAAVKLALKGLAQRHQLLTTELAALDGDLDRLVRAVAPTLCALTGVGTDVAGAMLVAAGDNPERLRSEGAFANLCGAAPLPASSGKTTGRHRLNRGGDRQANCALWRVVIVRLATHPSTKAYMARRTQEGLSKREIIWCLKRYVAREVYRELVPRPELAVAA
ncbi:MAG: IS110 family transposase [Candidatus Dormibacteraeota bacterium]|uniref:IS110 family transposase n=1 Tax=Candidatus Aeolococcus gillhamiae TaxID=3127015 RepID=A0A934JVP6_9BACT|nr:IS110 family transposase [Candidatus Dormibacteraeota bacterium]